MCVKFSPGDLNPDPYIPHSTITCTYRMIITPRVCGGKKCKNVSASLKYSENSIACGC